MKKCFNYHKFSGSAKPIVPAAKSERLLTLIRDVNNWTKPRDVAARDPPALATTRSSLPPEGLCPIFTHTHTGWEPDAPREVSRVFSCYKHKWFFGCRKGLQCQTLQDHCGEGWVKRKRSNVNLIQISGTEWTKQKMRKILQCFTHYLVRLHGILSMMIPEETQTSCDFTQLTVPSCTASCLYKVIFR